MGAQRHLQAAYRHLWVHIKIYEYIEALIGCTYYKCGCIHTSMGAYRHQLAHTNKYGCIEALLWCKDAYLGAQRRVDVHTNIYGCIKALMGADIFCYINGCIHTSLGEFRYIYGCIEVFTEIYEHIQTYLSAQRPLQGAY